MSNTYRTRSLVSASVSEAKEAVAMCESRVEEFHEAVKEMRGRSALDILPDATGDMDDDAVRAVGEPLLEHNRACSRAQRSLEAALQRLVEARAHLAIAASRLKLPAAAAERISS